MSIIDWHISQKPREKLIEHGAIGLTDAELLAIFLRTGIPGMDAVALGQHLIHTFGSLHRLFNVSYTELREIKGLGIAKYAQFQAILELSKRYYFEELQQKDVIDSPESLRRYLQHELQEQKFEQFWLIHLDNQHRVITMESLFSGTIDCAAVYPRVVVNNVIKQNSAAVIFAHNHPSGISEPSEADILLTRRLQQALNLIDVRTLDHFVIGCNQITSFAEKGLI